MRKSNSIVMLLAFIAFVFFRFDSEAWGLVSGCGLLNHLTFSFTHANIFHIACNAYCMLLMMWSANIKWWWWPFALVLVFMVSFAVPCHTVTVGFSGVQFAIIGMTLALGKLTWKRCLPVLVSLAVSVLLARNLAAGIHIMSCIVGFVAMLIVEGYKELRNDSRKLNDSLR